MEVFSFGNGDFLFQIFSAIRGIMGDGSFATLIRIAILLGFLFLIYQLLFSLNVLTISTGVLRHYIFVVVITGFLFTPKTNVVIRDEIKNSQVVVNNVPYGVGLFAHLFTTIERGITRMMENYFSTPSDIRFNQAGYAFSVILIDSFRDVVPRNPYFKLTLDDYVTNCFFHDVLWGDKNLQAIVFSNNVWADLSPANSANKFTKIYSQSSPAGEATTCSAAYGNLSSGFTTISSDAITALNKVLQVDIATKTAHVTNYLLGVSMSANQAIQQSVVANALKSSFARTAMYTGEAAAAVPYATGLAEISQRSSWMVAGELSKKYIPIMRQVLEAFVYGLFPLLFLMMLTPLGGRYFKVYITLLIWLLLWSPLFAILNLIVNVRANGVLSASYGYFSIGSMPYVYQSASDLTAMAGYMAWMVPMVALAIAKGSEHALSSMAQSVASSASFTSKSAASSISTPEGVERIAAHKGLLESTQAYGSMAMQGIAASKIYGIQQGMAMRNIGMAGTGMIADTEASGRHMDAKQLNDIAGKYGMTVENVQATIASDKYQQAIAGARERKAFADEFAKTHNTTPEAGYQFLAEIDMASNRAIHDAWGGQSKAYANFLKTGYELSAGQQKGLVAAAKAAGVNIKDYGQMTSFMEEMRKVGALDKFTSGEVSAQDLRNMGAVGLLSEKGMAEASQRMANVLGIGVDEAKANLATREGLNQYAKIEMRAMANRMLGGDDSDSSYYKYTQGVHASDSKTLTKDEAAYLQQAMRAAGYKEFTAREGDRATFAFNPTTGKFTMAHTERGGRSNTYDVGAVDIGKRHRIGDDIKTGNQVEAVNINRSIFDHTHTGRTGTDKQHLNIDTATTDIGTRIPSDTGLQMALNYNPSMYKNVVSAYMGNDFGKTQAEMTAVAASLAQGLSSYYGHTGKMTEQFFGRAFTEIGISAGVGSLFGGKINLGATGQVGVHSTSEKDQNINLVTKAFHEAQAHALKEGTRLGYTGEQLQAHVAAKVGQFTHALLNHANYDRGYGATGVYDYAKDAGAPLPLASDNEKKERVDRFHQEMKRKMGGK